MRSAQQDLGLRAGHADRAEQRAFHEGRSGRRDDRGDFTLRRGLRRIQVHVGLSRLQELRALLGRGACNARRHRRQDILRPVQCFTKRKEMDRDGARARLQVLDAARPGKEHVVGRDLGPAGGKRAGKCGGHFAEADECDSHCS
jgi:hypothetical protein